MPETPDPKIYAHPHRQSTSASASHGERRINSHNERYAHLDEQGSGEPSSTHGEPSTRYAELEVTSNFTFLTGASHPDEMVRRAVELGYRYIAITDTNSLAGIVRAHVAARDTNGRIRLVVGCRLVLTDLPAGMSILVYPTTLDAYGNLCELLTLGKRRANKGECHLMLHDLFDFQDEMRAIVVPPRTIDLDAIGLINGIHAVFDDDRLSIAASCAYGPNDRHRIEHLESLSVHTGIPMVATNDVHYHVPHRRALQDVLTCVRYGCTLDEAGYRLFPNGERYIKSAESMAGLFREYPEALARSIEIAEAASSFSLDEISYEYPHEICPPGMTPIQYLASLTYEGSLERYPEGMPDTVRDQVEHELELIDELNYAPYFLTVHDIVVFSRGRGILCQGRGAAANSAVCYCLGVTSVDPSRIDLLFERFISRERNEPPDIDIDFEHERREEVIQYIYQKYGRERAALTAEVISYRARSAVREVGKAMGLSLDCVDRMAKGIDWWEGGIVHEDRIHDLGLDPRDPTIRRWIALAEDLLGFPRHLSQHVGGFVMTHTPLSRLIPIENAAMPDRTVIEWDKDDIDAMGILKVDVLGLGMLTCVRKAFDLIGEGEGGSDEGSEGRREQGNEGTRERGRESTGVRKSAVESVGGGLSAVGCAAKGTWDVAQDSDIPGSHCMATRDEVGSSGVSSDHEDASERAVRLDESDATRVSIHTVQHRRGIREIESRRLPQASANRARFPGGVVNAVRTRDHAPDTRSRSEAVRSDGRDRSDFARTDQSHRAESAAEHQKTGEVTLVPSFPRSLVPSKKLHLHTVPSADPDVYDMICAADTVGVFQIESRAQMSMLPRLRPRCFYDLVIEVAIVRPGPIQGDMVHPYLRRRNGEEAVTYPDERVRKVLGKTLGVPLFQEQAMALAIVAAGFTPGEADEMRRAMAAWKRKTTRLHELGEKLIDGMIENGYEPEFAYRCFEQIKGFSEYGFPESHAASFALITYVSCWLKYHYPAEFAAALINAQPMGFYAPAQIIRDAREHGVSVRPIDVNHSAWDCTMAPRSGSMSFKPMKHQKPGAVPNGWPHRDIQLGMRLVKGLKEEQAERVVNVVSDRRSEPFETIESLWRASGVSLATLRALARADAFNSMGLDRQHALWEIRRLKDVAMPLFEAKEGGKESAPSTTTRSLAPSLTLPPVGPARQVIHDYAATGLSLKAHPVSFIRDSLNEMAVRRASDLLDERRCPNGLQVAVAGVVLIRQRPGTASGIIFMTLEDETGIANLVVYPHIFSAYRKAARHGIIILAHGHVQREKDVVHVMVRSIEDLDHLTAPLFVKARNFH